MIVFQCLFILIIGLIIQVNSWDIAVTHGDQIEFFTNATKTDDEGIRFRELTALAYDAVHNMLLFVDKQNDNASIFSFHIDTKKYQPLVKRKLYENIQGLAFDPVQGIIFWTDTYERSILWTSIMAGVKNNSYGNILIKMDDELPRAIAVDSCRGYIYWTNTNISNPTIERAKFDGSDRKVIIDKDIYMPVSIAIDQQSGRIYWADDKEGIHFSIESSDLEGGDRKSLLKGQFHQPNSLTVSKDHIYWMEWGYNSVWRMSKNPIKDEEPKTMFSFINKLPLPFGIVANYDIEEQTRGVKECATLTSLAQNKSVVNTTFSTVPKREGLFCLHGEVVNGKLECKCASGYVGERCEKFVCQNYCLNGDCSIDSEDQPVCKCKAGFFGPRCQSNICDNLCLNQGDCHLEGATPVCRCLSDFEGDRCEDRKFEFTTTQKVIHDNYVEYRKEVNETRVIVTEESCDSWDPVRDPILMFLGVFSGTMSVACAILVTRIMKLKKRPRIKKRIIVNKNVTPLTARPDQCEITIENCCNMNICETPCFEPRTIRPNLLNMKSGKEEKKTLIDNMENGDH